MKVGLVLKTKEQPDISERMVMMKWYDHVLILWSCVFICLAYNSLGWDLEYVLLFFLMHNNIRLSYLGKKK